MEIESIQKIQDFGRNFIYEILSTGKKVSLQFQILYV